MENIISDESENGDYESYQERSINGYPVCRGCYKEIYDKYFLRVNETSWHEECLKCNLCSQSLVSEETCFIKKRKIFCKLDYYKNFGIKCSKCNRNIQSSDWVRRAKDYVYHLACFACENCKRQLSTGEEFALQDNKVLCKTHYCEIVEGENGSKEENSKSKNKRVRTTFTEEQLQVLQANFEIDSNPDGQDLERIAQITGLSKRVTQVWFQNSRARQKKYKEKKIEMGGSGGSLSMMEDTNNTSNDEDVWSSNSEYKSHHHHHHHHHQSQQQSQLQPTMLTNLGGSDFRVTGYTSETTLHEIKQHNQHHHHHQSKKVKKCRSKFKSSNLNQSWASDESASDDDEANENNSMYDSSMEFNHDID